VLSADGARMFAPLTADVSSSIQPAPAGMGDAIFQCADVWSRYDAILIVWGDQVFVSRDTLARAITALQTPDRHVVLPLTRMTTPYVEYVFGGGRLTRVLQMREGDITTPNGWSDVGTFLLGTAGLQAAWVDYISNAPPGGQTGEINFLPFLPFLSARRWGITPLEVADATEARGINTQDDLAFFQSLYKKRP
jgi:bifunctional UDP-N-acetylglucosamine pyrophosphorylase/glucosamine-1-phosphate N-acetyltransferase